MRSFIITSDRYNFLLEGYIQLFTKYWTGDDVDTVILGFDSPDIILPNNFEFTSMGKQKDFPTWTSPLITFFESIDDEYLLLSFEDHYLVKPVDATRLAEGIALMEAGGVDKLYLHKDYTSKASVLYSGNWYTCTDTPSTLHTTSLLPSIWKREFLIKLLKNAQDSGGVDCHQFERLNNISSPLGCNVLITKDVTVFPNLDAARRNSFNTGIINKFDKTGSADSDKDFAKDLYSEDIDVFRRMQSIAIARGWIHYLR